MNKIAYFVLYCFVPSIMLDYFFLMFGVDLHRIIAAPFIIGIDFFALYLLYKQLNTGKKTKGWYLFFLWFVINLGSIYSYLYNGRPFNCYIEIIRPLIFPMLFFFYGYFTKDSDNRFYRIYLFSCIACFVIGFFLYFTMPPFYVEHLLNIKQNGLSDGTAEDYLIEFGRMSSFFSDSYAISYTSVPALALALGFLKDKVFSKKTLLISFAIICLLSSILCQQRAAIATSVLVLLFYIIYNKDFKVSRFIMVAGIASIIGFYFLVEYTRYDVISSMLNSRYDDFFSSESMDSGRSSQYERILEVWNNFLTGDGIGACSSIARKYGFRGVSDGEYIRILTETGVLGLVTFVILVLATLKRCVKNLENYHIEMCIIVFFLLAMIGSNSLSIHFLYATIFWFSIGRVWHKTNNNILHV